MAEIGISSPLRRFCDTKAVLQGTGDTVLEAVTDAVSPFPRLREKVLRSEAEIHPQVLVYLDGRILMENREEIEVGESSELQLLLIIGGG